VTETIRPSSTVTRSKTRRRILFRSEASLSRSQSEPKLASAAAAPGVGEDWRLECREFGLQHALVGFVLLPRGVLAARF